MCTVGDGGISGGLSEQTERTQLVESCGAFGPDHAVELVSAHPGAASGPVTRAELREVLTRPERPAARPAALRQRAL